MNTTASPGFAETEKRCDPREAPPGYFATPKETANPPGVTANLCRQCDYRPHCNAETAKVHRCMSYTIVLADGREIGRSDGVSVVFKRLPPNAEVSGRASGE